MDSLGDNMALGFGDYSNLGKQVIYRQPTNPMDRSTIVTLIPKIIVELKPTLFPGKFIIPAAKPGDYELYIVEPTSWFMPNQNEDQPPTEVPINSVELAKSIVMDYCNGILLCDMKDQMPGLFYIPGEWNKKNIVNYATPAITDKDGNIVIPSKTFNDLLSEARFKQKNWFLALTQSADQLWARSGGNPLTITDDARLAAEILQLKDKPWMKDFNTISLINCKFCGELINPNFPICKHCHAIIDPKKAKELDIQFAAK